MKYILIIEDDKRQRESLVENAHQLNINLEIKSTGSAEEALEIAMKYDIEVFFIDIQLVDGSGLELAKKLRMIERYRFTPMIFITAVPTKEMEAFHEVHCYDYIIKPFTSEMIRKTMKKILVDYIAETVKNSDESLYLNFNGVKQRVSFTDIVYIEYSMRKIDIVTRFERIKYKSIPLKNFKEQLSDDFLQVHQAFIINKLYVEKIDVNENYIVLSEIDTKIPIGISFRKKVGELLDGVL